MTSMLYSTQEQNYLKELADYSSNIYLSDEEFDNLILKYRRTKSPAILDLIFKQVIKFIVYYAKKYKTHDVDVRDLLHEAIEVVVEAVEFHYKIDMDNKFTTYIKLLLSRPIQDHKDISQQAVGLPKNILSEQRQLKASGNLEEQTIFKKVPAGTPYELKKLVHKYGVGEIHSPEDTMMQESLEFDIFRILENLLTTSERHVIIHTFGLYGVNTKPLKSIGDSLGVTPQRVGDLRNSALKKLRANKKCKEILVDYLS